MPQAMKLYGLDDMIGVVDPYDIALEQLGKIAKDLPPEKYGEAAKKFPEDFIRSLCKEGVKQDLQAMLPDIGIALSSAIGIGAATKSVLWGVGTGVATFALVRIIRSM